MSVIMVDPLWSTTQSQKSSIPSVPACTGDTNGNIKALVTNPAVRSDALSEIFAWKQEGSTFNIWLHV